MFLLTLAATAVFDLTQAIVLGLGFSALIFVFQSSNSEVLHRPVSVEAMRRQGYDLLHDADRIVVVYVVGPLFFGTVHRSTRYWKAWTSAGGHHFEPAHRAFD